MKTNKNKIVKTSTILIRHFIIYSLLAILAFAISYSVFTNLYTNYTRRDAASYFAETTNNKSYPYIEHDKIINAGGWIISQNEQGDIIDCAGMDNINTISLTDISDLVNGIYEYNGVKYYATLASYLQDEEVRLLIVALPSEKAGTTNFLINLFDTAMDSYITILLITLILFIILYLFITIMVSRNLNKKIVSPILAITHALESLESGEYNVSMNFDANNEFIFIKKAFDMMLLRLHDAEQERKNRQQEIIKILSDISHDLRTPITKIRGLVQAILFDKIKDEKKKQEYIEIIFKNIKILSELIEIQLDYTLWERKDYSISINHENLSECLRDIIITNYPLCDENRIELNVNIPDDDVYYDMNIGQLRRAFSNILTNAIFHNKISENLKIGVYLIDNQDTIQIIIADSGLDIPSNIKSTLLSSNYKIESSRTGHGLGITIAKKIIAQYGGNLHLEENWRNYTKAFVITLPKN